MILLRIAALEIYLKLVFKPCTTVFSYSYCLLQWIAEEVMSRPTDDVMAFKTLRGLGKDAVTYKQQEYIIIEHTGTNMSVFKNSVGKLDKRQNLFGAVVRFERANDRSDDNGRDDQPAQKSFTNANVVVSREPAEVFGRQEFVFPVHKLRKATVKEIGDEEAKAQRALPSEFEVVTVASSGQEDGPAVRPRPMQPNQAATITAKTPLRHTSVTLLNKSYSRGASK